MLAAHLVRAHLDFCTLWGTRSSAVAERPRCSLFKLWQNISLKSVHLTLLYVTALTSTNHHFTVLWHHVCT